MGFIFKKETREVDVATDVICDVCKCSALYNKDDINSAEVIAIKQTFGYFSNHKDGLSFEAIICESCFDEIVKAFNLQPCYTYHGYMAEIELDELHPNGWLNDVINGRVGQIDLPFPNDGAIEL